MPATKTPLPRLCARSITISFNPRTFIDCFSSNGTSEYEHFIHAPQELTELSSLRRQDRSSPLLGALNQVVGQRGVWKRNNSKNYAAVFRDKNGIRRCISTGTSNRKQARKIADTYETAARTKRTLLQTQKVIERLHEEMTGEMIARVTTRSRIVDWLATKKP